MISQITRHEQGGVITCGKDGLVRIWSDGLDLWGSLNQLNTARDELWSFPIKDKHVKEEKDITHMQNMVALMGTEEDKSKIIKVD